MKRRLFNIATALSLLLCIAVAVLWARSKPYDERITANYARWPKSNELFSYYFEVASYAGTFQFRFDREHYQPEYFLDWPAEIASRHKDFPTRLRTRFISQRESDMNYFLAEYPRPGFWSAHWAEERQSHRFNNGFIVAFRDWVPTAIFSLLPALWLIRVLKSRRAIRKGLCPQCGYDLRATPDRCPECGLPANPKS
jgi:hypothetical protein